MQPADRTREITEARLEERTRAAYASAVESLRRASGCDIPFASAAALCDAFAMLEGHDRCWLYTVRAAVIAAYVDRGLKAPAFDRAPFLPFWRGLCKTCEDDRGTQQSVDYATFRAMVDECIAEHSLAGWRNAVGIVLQFVGIRRFDEVARLGKGDLRDLGKP